jgi:hypothetical protein
MYLCVAVDVSGGVIGIGPSSIQGQPVGGTSKWFPPFSCMMLML